MAISRGSKVLVLAAVSLGVGCTSLLGDFEVSPAVLPEAGPEETQQQQGDAAAPTADGGGVLRPCEQASDCPAVPMQPAGCALAQCKDKACIYVAVDKDGDGHPVAGCQVEGVRIPGDDCADDAPTVFPGAECSKRPEGTDIVFPNGTPLGACKTGVWDCATGVAVCKGAVAPEPVENCALKNDANCDGIPDDGCDCPPNTTGPCGNVGGLPLPCKAGTRTCSAAGKWGDCVGNVEPSARDCSSTADNDCNGSPDRTEDACECNGDIAQGKSTPCTVLGKKGVCANGTRTCVPSPNKQTGVFTACTGPSPGAVQCKSAADNDCDGVSDELEVACGSPCKDPLGSGALVPAAQKFSGTMWGCPGRRNFVARAAACNTGFAPCKVGVWTTYTRGAFSRIPTRQYWLLDTLKWGGTATACYAAVTAPAACANGSSMAVCAPGTDADNNTCNWTGCTSGLSYSVNDRLGGCINTNTAGTLCCQ